MTKQPIQYKANFLQKRCVSQSQPIQAAFLLVLIHLQCTVHCGDFRLLFLTALRFLDLSVLIMHWRIKCALTMRPMSFPTVRTWICTIQTWKSEMYTFRGPAVLGLSNRSPSSVHRIPIIVSSTPSLNVFRTHSFGLSLHVFCHCMKVKLTVWRTSTV